MKKEPIELTFKYKNIKELLEALEESFFEDREAYEKCIQDMCFELARDFMEVDDSVFTEEQLMWYRKASNCFMETYKALKEPFPQ